MNYSSRTGRWRAIALALLIGMWTNAPVARARPIPWKSNHFEYVADRKDLKDVLRDLGASQNVVTWISPQVDGIVTGKFAETPQHFLDRMTDSFGFIWYYDGSVLRVSGPNEARSATIGLVHASAVDLRGALERLGVTDSRFPVLYDDKTNTVVVSGPARMVELATDVAHQIDRSSEAGDEPEVRSFALRYAWAADRTLTINGGPIVVPGVATVLASLYPEVPRTSDGGTQSHAGEDAYRLRSIDGDSANLQPGAADRSNPFLPLPRAFGGAAIPSQFAQEAGSRPPLPANTQFLGAFGGQGEAGTRASAAMGGPIAPAPGLGGDIAPAAAPGRPAAPIIRADARNNAVLVRARADLMPAIEQMIASLDRRPRMLEIDASIIEITEQGLQELGVDWRVHSSHVDFENGNGQSTQTAYPDSVNPQGFAGPSGSGSISTLSSAAGSVVSSTPPGAVLTAVIGGTGRYLLSRISALEQTDNARITASPKVATLDNMEAIMDNKQTFYVPVQGFESGSLFSVSAGVALRVLPNVVSVGDRAQIRLDVHIEDGKLTSEKVGQLPVVNKSTIDTQALIEQGQSLLIAGYTEDQDDRSESGVPLLSKIPLIGGLFRFKHHDGRKFQRLFLLTPRIVSADRDDGPVT